MTRHREPDSTSAKTELVGHERAGTAYDPGAVGHELAGRLRAASVLTDSADEEMSELEVQRMLEQADREEANEPERAPPLSAIVPPAPGEPHLLDAAPINSKIVVTEDGAVLATPAGPRLIAKSDIASRLPRGARIQKIADGVFRAIQLDAGFPVTAKDYGNTAAAIFDFNAEFHQRQAAGVKPT